MDSTLEVTAVGRAQSVPDQVVVGLGVDVRDATIGLAVGGASEAVEQLLGVLDGAGVTPQDRQTTGLSVQEHDGQNGPEGFVASSQLQVVVRDLAAAGRLVQTAAERIEGLLRVFDVALDVGDPLPSEARAREQAVHAARAQAEQLAAPVLTRPDTGHSSLVTSGGLRSPLR
ncbi:MAG: hypothetical protein JWN17_2537 [Frankiales bacterium]|nr:hypothetical protein [Frankiales bacterium]